MENRCQEKIYFFGQKAMASSKAMRPMGKPTILADTREMTPKTTQAATIVVLHMVV